MLTLLTAIRNELIADATLTTLVTAGSITSSFVPQDSTYPSVVISITDGGSRIEIPGATWAELNIEIFGNTNKKEIHDIYARVKTLLHHQERNITDASCLVHVIYESEFDDAGIDAIVSVWRIRARYTVLFTTASVTNFAVQNGSIYVNTTDVTAIAGDKIAEFRGDLILDTKFSKAVQTEGERYPKSPYYYGGLVKVTIEEVMFLEASFNKLWSVTVNGSDTLADGTTAGTSYTVTQSTIPRENQWLFQAIKTVDGKIIELEADKAVCESLLIPFSKQDLVRHNLKFNCYGDSSDNIIKATTEN